MLTADLGNTYIDMQICELDKILEDDYDEEEYFPVKPLPRVSLSISQT